MRPLLEAEDLIVVRPGVERLGLGDVILFRQGDVIWAHRVIEVEQNGGVPIYITMGDAARTADEPVGRDQVLGRVVAVKKAGGTIRLETFLQQVYGRVAALRSRRRAKPDRWPKP